jgi:hypothetical protein
MNWFSSYCPTCLAPACPGLAACPGLDPHDTGPPLPLYFQRPQPLDRAILAILSRTEVAFLPLARARERIAHLPPKARARLTPLRRNTRQRFREATLRKPRRAV